MADVVAVAIPREYGYVVLTFVLSIVMLIYMTIMVSKARKTYKVPYPILYTTDEKSRTFNCVQRAHQNTLEVYTQNILTLLVGGIQHPVVCSIGGIVWIVSRVVYARGYSTGDPSKRLYGNFGYLGSITMLGCTVSLALHLLQFV